MEKKLFVLQDVIEDIQHELALLDSNMIKMTSNKAAARRCRKITINLEKLFKRMRKVSCEAGLK